MLELPCQLLRFVPGFVTLTWTPPWLGVLRMVVAHLRVMLKRADAVKLRMGLLHWYPNHPRWGNKQPPYKPPPLFTWMPLWVEQHLMWLLLLCVTWHCDNIRKRLVEHGVAAMWEGISFGFLTAFMDMILPLCYTVCYDELTNLNSGNRELKS